MASLNGILVYSESVSWVEIDNEIFAFDELSESIYLFRELEREIWKLINQKNAILFVVNFMEKQFNTEANMTLNIIAKFKEKRLVKEVEA